MKSLVQTPILLKKRRRKKRRKENYGAIYTKYYGVFPAKETTFQLIQYPLP
jgi:hypothetical protein